MVGAFWQPLGVLIDTSVLATLPDREYRAGLAEVVKYGVILDAQLFDYLERHTSEINSRDGGVLEHVILRCCRLKADVVEADEREETGGRAVLNYGHTFAHAFEAIAGYGTLLHGEAVAIGMVCAARLSQRIGQLAGRDASRQERLLAALGLPTQVPALDRAALLGAMTRDKKVEHGRLRFVLADRIGHVPPGRRHRRGPRRGGLFRLNESSHESGSPVTARDSGPATPVVLVVEDNEGLALAMSKILELEGLQTRIACSGKAAIEHLADGEPSLMLVDYDLSDIARTN